MQNGLYMLNEEILLLLNCGTTGIQKVDKLIHQLMCQSLDRISLRGQKELF